MKVSPMAAGSGGSPGVDIGNVNLGATASPEKLAAAKAVASGQEPQREEIERDERGRIQSVRKITMKTNASPLVYEPEAVEVAPEVPDSTKLDAGGQTNAAVESTQPLSPQFAALAKQRRALQVKERELAEREAKVVQPPQGDYISKADLLANPLKIFESGLTYDQLTEAILSSQNGNSTDLNAIKDDLLKTLDERVEKRFVSQQEVQEEAALSAIADDMEALAKEGDTYELFRERNGLQRGLNKIYSHFKRTGQVLDIADVMNQVENELLDHYVKLAGHKKVLSKIAPPPVQQPQLQGKQMKTLTNRDGASIPLDRKARAMAAFHRKT